MNPLFSIITVTRNAAETLPITLKSVAEQTCALYEFLLIDGNSSDNTVALAREMQGLQNVGILSEPDKGLYDAMNKGLGLAEGDYVIFLNAGDSFHSKETLQQLADTILDNDYPGIVYGQTDIVNLKGEKIADRHLMAPEVLTLDSFKTGMVVCHQSFVVLRKLTNNYDTRLKLSADYEWCIRCLQRSHRNHYTGTTIANFLEGGLSTKQHRKSLWERFWIMCHYYGFLPTVFRHIGFAWRNLRRKH